MKRGYVHGFVAAFALGALLIGCPLSGGERTNIRGLGMGRTFVAGARGLDAVGLNPAGLAYPDSGFVSVGLVPFGVRVGSNVMTYGMYRDYFTGVPTDTNTGRIGRYLTEADKQRILNAFPDGIGTFSGDLEFRPLGVAFGAGPLGHVALTVTDRVALLATIPRDYAQFLLEGNLPGQSYDFTSTSVRAQWTREYALTFARAIPPPLFLRSLKAGIGLKFVQGLGYYDLSDMSTTFVTAPDGVLNGNVNLVTRQAGFSQVGGQENSSFSPFPQPSGAGWGIDLGVTGEVTEFLSAGLALTDIGEIRWTNGLQTARVDSSFSVNEVGVDAQRNAVQNALKGTRGPGQPFSTALPTRLRLGVEADLNKIPVIRRFMFGQMSVAADYNQGFQNVPGSTTHGRLSLGMEYKPFSFLPIRTGVSFGGEDATDLALGIGFHFGFLDFDLASENIGWIFNTDSFSYGSVAAGFTLHL